MADSRPEAGFLGRGWSFPTRFDPKKGAVTMVSREDDIIESLRILFLTRPGERVMQPAYGCPLHELVFEGMTPETEASIELAVRRAILFFEPRIEVTEVLVESPDWLDGRMTILLGYRIRATNSRQNVVFPFYLREGTLLGAAPAPA